MQVRIQSSQKKKLISETSEHKEIEMVFLDKQSSRQFNQVRQQIMKTALRKQSHLSFSRNRSSASNIHKEVNPKQFKTHISQKNLEEPQKEKSKENSQKLEIQSQDKVVEEEQVKRTPYKFSYKSFAIELTIAYAVTFAILYFIKLTEFPFFQLILVIAFTVAIQPWRSSNLLMLIASGIVIGNHYLGLSLFTYPSIVICYYAVMVFNQNYKKKQLFVLVLIFILIFGFKIIPAIVQSLNSQEKQSIYPYIFPIIMLLLRTVLSCAYQFIDHTAIIFLQLPLFLTGLEYGAILFFNLQTIQFWYLLVAFSLQIINDRTHFLKKIIVSIVENCSKDKNQFQKNLKIKAKQYPVLPAHANGYACLHSFHLFILVYIYTGLGLYTPPFKPQEQIGKYTNPGYKPVVVWLLSSIYEVMGILLSKNKKNIMFFGFISNKWWRSVLRGFVLSLGMWAFYLGLGLGVIMFKFNIS